MKEKKTISNNRAGRESHKAFSLRTVRLIFVLVVLVGGCHSDSRVSYVSPYGSPFAKRMTEEERKELYFYVAWELRAQQILKEHAGERGKVSNE